MSGNAAPDQGPGGDQQLMARLFSPAARADPYPLYQDAPLPGCRHAIASRMLKDPRLGPPMLGLETANELMWRTFARWLLNLDGDRHRAMRQRFARIFTPGRVERYRPAIEARAHALIDAVAATGQMDLVTDFARPLPFAIVTSVLGVPEDRRPWLAERMHTLDTGFAHQHDPNAVATTSGAVREMLDYFSELLDQRARAPQDDLMSRLAADPPADDEGRADLLANCVFFITPATSPPRASSPAAFCCSSRTPSSWPGCDRTPASCRTRSKRCSAWCHPSVSCCAAPATMSRSTDTTSLLASSAWSSRLAPTATPAPSPIPAPSTSAAAPTHTSPSARAHTSASARHSRACTVRSRSTSCSNVSPASSSPGSPSGSARYRSACPSISRSPGARPVSELVMDTAGCAARRRLDR